MCPVVLLVRWKSKAQMLQKSGSKSAEWIPTKHTRSQAELTVGRLGIRPQGFPTQCVRACVGGWKGCIGGWFPREKT